MKNTTTDSNADNNENNVDMTNMLIEYRHEPFKPFNANELVEQARKKAADDEDMDDSENADIENIISKEREAKNHFNDDNEIELESYDEDDSSSEDSDDKLDSDDDSDDNSKYAWNDDDMSVILDKSTMGAIKRNDTLFFWQIEGLLKENGTQYSWMHLRDNPPRLVFKRPNEEPFIVILGKAEVNQLAPALERVRRAYNAVPIDDPKKEHWNKKNWKRKLKDSFEDNPIGFITKIAGTILIVILMILAIILSR